MEISQVLDKIRKLLRLADRAGCPEEAAAAAAAAQRLQSAYRIETLTLEEAAPETAQPIGQAPLTDPNVSRSTWRGRLAMALAKANGCRVFYHHDVLQVVGRPSDQSAMRELFGWLSVSIDRLAVQHCAGLGRTYANNFRLGVVETVSTKLSEETRVREEALRTASAESSHALVLVRKADTEVSDWVRANLHLNRGARSSARRDDGARASGRTAGQGLDVTRRRQLPNSRLLAAAC